MFWEVKGLIISKICSHKNSVVTLFGLEKSGVDPFQEMLTSTSRKNLPQIEEIKDYQLLGNPFISPSELSTRVKV